MRSVPSDGTFDSSAAAGPWAHTDSEPEPNSGNGGGQPGRPTGHARPRSGHRTTDGPRPGATTGPQACTGPMNATKGHVRQFWICNQGHRSVSAAPYLLTRRRPPPIGTAAHLAASPDVRPSAETPSCSSPQGGGDSRPQPLGRSRLQLRVVLAVSRGVITRSKIPTAAGGSPAFWPCRHARPLRGPCCRAGS